MTRQELESLAHLRRARDLIDREYAKPLDVRLRASRGHGDARLCRSGAHAQRRTTSRRIGEAAGEVAA